MQIKNETEKLESCPFCKCDFVGKGITNSPIEPYLVYCPVCGILIIGATEKEVIERWNRRAGEEK